MTQTVFIDGAAGTTGLEIAERLAGRAEFSLITLDEARRKDAAARHEALNEADFVILCLPDAAAVEAVGMIANDRTRVIDASTESFVFELTGKPDKIDQFIVLMTPLGLVEVSRTGICAIARGPEEM